MSGMTWALSPSGDLLMLVDSAHTAFREVTAAHQDIAIILAIAGWTLRVLAWPFAT